MAQVHKPQIIEGALQLLSAYCTKHVLVQCGGKGDARGGVAKRIIQQKQNAVELLWRNT